MKITFLLLNPTSFLSVLITIITLISSIASQPAYTYPFCSDPQNITENASYTSNLSALLSSLSSKASLNSFYTDSSNGIYSLYLCRGDVSSNTCQTCINNATREIQRRCASNETAIIWFDECMLRYSNKNFHGVYQTYPRLFLWNNENTTSPDEQNFGALSLIYTLIEYVPYTDMMFGTNQSASHDGSQKRYALTQCSRDINSSDCSSCLGILRDDVTQCCQAKRGWRIFAPSCSVRYEESQFYQLSSTPVPVPSPQVPEPVPGGNGGNNTTMIVIATVVSSLAVAVALLLFWYFSCWKGPRRTEERSQEILLRENSNRSYLNEGELPITGYDNGEQMHNFNLTTIRLATNNFSDENKLGEGGFGPVYKGILPAGEEIAVKRLSMVSKQGLEEFRNEVMVIAKLQHKNLVRLLGYCLEGDEKLLVYEYLANTSLDAFLFDPEKSRELDWPKRANIISGTARGLQYLHEDSRLKIVHRDMKASNILLDDQMHPKISDFGTARIFGGNQLEANTNKVVGTFGYMAPEYALEGIISTKSDVYSFGILLLEIITGKKNRGFYSQYQAQSLLLHAWQLWNEGTGKELIDRNIIDSCPVSEALRWIHIALLCVQDDPARRPTMSLVVLMLGSNAVNLPQPSAGPKSLVKFTSILSRQSSASLSGSSFLASDHSTASVLLGS
ncbi:hypothetical protein NC652_027330 [Populus alba x Populus x berolinensis]|nr:hypothetical protein NC652_027330 [Populus alba x Populus x berolinensis]